VAAPIRNAAGHVFASISVTSVVERMPERRLLGLADTVIQAADQVSRQLGWLGARSEEIAAEPGFEPLRA
jgi:DNA-binding IclR family transcriptional regulator